jgi:hypothetical protein
MGDGLYMWGCAVVFPAQGLNEISVTAMDKVGNISGPAKVAVVYDNVPPSVSFDEPPNYANKTSIKLKGKFGDEYGMNYIEVNGARAALNFADNTFEITVPIAEGSNFFVAEAVDMAGNSKSTDLLR